MFKKLLSVISFCFFTLFVLCGSSFAQSEVVQVTTFKGLVQVKKLDDSQWHKVQGVAELYSGDQIRSFLASSATLLFPDKSEFYLGENSSLDIKDVSTNPRTKISKRELKLNLGSLHYKVVPKSETAAEYKIHSSTSIVGITGTEGVFSSKGDGKVTENVLIEGSTYNTDDSGQSGVYQKAGYIYKDAKTANDSKVFKANVQTEAQEQVSISVKYRDMVDNMVKSIELKKSEGFNLNDTQSIVTESFRRLEKREYKRIEEMDVQIKAILEKSKRINAPIEILQKIQDLKLQIKLKDQAGFDVVTLYGLFNDIEQKVMVGEYTELDTKILNINQKLLALEDAMATNDSFLAHYNDVQTIVLEKERRGFVLDELKAKLRESLVYYDNGNATLAYSLLQNVRNDAQVVVKGVSPSLQIKINQVTQEIKDKKDAGFEVVSLEAMLNEVQKLVEAQYFLKVYDHIKEINVALLNLRSNAMIEWQEKLNVLKTDISYKEALGYSLGQVNDGVQSLQGAIDSNNLSRIKTLYGDIQKQITQAPLPAGFKSDLEIFVSQLSNKEELGFNIKDIELLKQRVEQAIDNGNIITARSFLKQAKNQLKKLKDQEPPQIQVLNFIEEDSSIIVEGFVRDNTNGVLVSVNNMFVKVAKDGKFIYKTAPSKGLTSLILKATDVAGNQSPILTLPVTPSNTIGTDKKEINETILEYLNEALVVKGKFISGGRVFINDQEVLSDLDGKFHTIIEPVEKVVVVGLYDDGTKTAETILQSEDKWAPKVVINNVTFSKNIAPALQVSPIVYDGRDMTVSGNVKATVMAHIKGSVVDANDLIKVFVNDRIVELDKGTFNASFSISDKDSIATVRVSDEAGNTTERVVALDVIREELKLFINDRVVRLSSQGDFKQRVPLNKDIKEVNVVLKNKKGVQVSTRTLVVADVLPPQLEIFNVSYVDGSVIILGRTDGQAKVVDKEAILFKEVTADKTGFFTLKSTSPKVESNVKLIAKDSEGKISEELLLTIYPIKDTKSPRLYLSSPQFLNDSILVNGFVEDNSGVQSVTVDGVNVTVNEQGYFAHKVMLLTETESVVVLAVDNHSNQTRKVIAVDDRQKPSVTIDTWEVKDGYLVIEGVARDNVGVREIRLNNMPLVQSNETEVAFSYKGVLTERSSEAIIVAVDLSDNQSSEGPRAIDIPSDSSAPTSEAVTLNYGSPIVYISGSVEDAGGIKAVYVNGVPTDVFEDGSFNVKVDIDVKPPVIQMQAPEYTDGEVTLFGKVAVGGFSPTSIIVEAEDLDGNRAVLSTQEVKPYSLDEIDVYVGGEAVVMGDDGAFKFSKILINSEPTIIVKAIDPFDNELERLRSLDSVDPILTFNDITYNTDEKSALLSGKAEDVDSGVHTVTVNDVRVDIDDSGSFEYKASFIDTSLNVVVTDYLGNTVSLTKSILAPDVWPPLFNVQIKPTPAVVGTPVYVEITVVDSQTGLPELLVDLPKVIAEIDGKATPLQVQGEGSSFIAILPTEDLLPSIIPIKVEGADKAGNKSSDVEGATVITLISNDKIAPSFSIEATPFPMILGEQVVMRVFISEQLSESPTMTMIMPSGETQEISLNDVNKQELSADFLVPIESGLGEAVVRLAGGKDLSGNIHDVTEVLFNINAPSATGGIPLNIEDINLTHNQFMIRGFTASEAIVRLEAGPHATDIVADTQGRFMFNTPVTFQELEDMHSNGPTIRIKLKAHNYAGFESRVEAFELDLPPLFDQGARNFNISIDPPVVEQGSMARFTVEVLNKQNKDLRGIIYLPDGQRVAVDLQGDDTATGEYLFKEDVILGPAFFEVVAGDTREGREFDIGLSSDWMQRLNKDEFYNIRVNPDPLIIGQKAEIFVETLGDIDAVPELQLLLSNGRRETIALSGSGRNFRGVYEVPSDVPMGLAEVILNPGTDQEVRRVLGVEAEYRGGSAGDVFIHVNPNPLMAGESFNVQIGFAEDINFMPTLTLQLSNGQTIDVPLNASLPTNNFNAEMILPDLTPDGMVNFILRDEQGDVLSMFASHVMPPLLNTNGVNLVLTPNIMLHDDYVSIQLDTVNLIKDDLSAHIDFVDGSKLLIPLTGDGRSFNGGFEVPDYVMFGLVNVSVFTSDGTIIGTVRGEVVDANHQGTGAQLFIANPDFNPGDLVNIDLEVKWPLYLKPKAMFKYDGGSLEIDLLGPVPGNRFHGEFIAPSVPIENGTIEVFDPQGFLIAELRLDHKGEGDGDVIITPMPPVLGQPLSVQIMAPSIVASAPTVRLIFMDGSSRELNTYGALPGDEFIASLDQLLNPLQIIEIIHDGQVVDVINIDSAVAGSPFNLQGSPLIVTPVLPVVGSSVNISLNTDRNIFNHPMLRINYDNGDQEEVSMQGVLPGNYFTHTIGSLVYSISTIDVINPVNSNVLFTWEAHQTVDNNLSVIINVTPDPPLPTQDLVVFASFDHPTTFVPQVIMTLNNDDVRSYFFTEPPGLTEYKLIIPVADLVDSIQRIEIHDDFGGFIGERLFDFGSTANISDGYINVTPDPPVLFTNFAIQVTFNQPPTFVPMVFIEFGNGQVIEQPFPQPAGLFEYNITISGAVIVDGIARVGVKDDQGGVLFDRLFDDGFKVPGVTISSNPQDPLPFQDFELIVNFDAPSPFIPRAVLMLVDGTLLEQDFPQPAGLTTYSLLIQGSIITDYIEWMELRDDVGNVLAQHHPSVGGGLEVTDIDVSPFPPTAGDDIQINVEFSQNVQFQPRVIIDFFDQAPLEFTFNGAAGSSSYQVLIPSASIPGAIDKITIIDDGGQMILDGEFYFGPVANLEYPDGLFVQVTAVSGEIKVFWNNVSNVEGYRVYYGTSSKSYNESGSPIEIADPNATQAIINGLTDGTEYFITVESYNTNEQSINPVELSAFPGSGVGTVDHFELMAERDSSEIGDPIFVTVTAYDATGNIVTGYNSNVTLDVSESGIGKIHESWLLSVQDRVAGAGDTAIVEMYDGQGFLTVDSLEPKTILLDIVGETNANAALDLDFTGKEAVNHIASFAIDGQSKAVVGSGSDDGTLIFVSPVDSSGNVISDYDGSATLSLTGGGSPYFQAEEVSGTLVGSGTGPYNYTFTADDNGKIVLRLLSTTGGIVSIDETIKGSNTLAVVFAGPTKFLISAGGSFATSFDAVSGSVNQTKTFTVQAALDNNEIVTSYSGTATWKKVGGTNIIGPNGANNANTAITGFTNGQATFNVSNTIYEQTQFQVEDLAATPNLLSGTITVEFRSADQNPPEVTDIVVENPWLIRVNFSEEVDEVQAMNQSNYSVGGASIDKICWYGDHITINLGSTLTLGATNASVTIQKQVLTDADGNVAAANYNITTLRVPNVDHQGQALGGSDWFELQPSNTNPAIGEEVKVTVYHKNACGYLQGGNAINATTGGAGDGTVGVNYGGTINGDSNFSISDGVGTFTFTPTTAGSFTITVTLGIVSGTTTITVP